MAHKNIIKGFNGSRKTQQKTRGNSEFSLKMAGSEERARKRTQQNAGGAARGEREREREKKRVAFLFGDTSRVSRFVRRRRRRFSFAGAVSNPKKGKYEKSSPAREREREAANFPERSSTGTNLIAIQLLTPESLMLIEKNKRRYSRF